MTATEQPTRVVHEDGSTVELSEFVDVLMERMGTEFATKEDLKKFATKEDLKNFATKENLSEFRGEMTAWGFQMDTKIDDLSARFGKVEKRLTNIELMLQRVLRRLPPP